DPVQVRAGLPGVVDVVPAAEMETAAVVPAPIVLRDTLVDLVLPPVAGEAVGGQDIDPHQAAAAFGEVTELGAELDAAARHPAWLQGHVVVRRQVEVDRLRPV